MNVAVNDLPGMRIFIGMYHDHPWPSMTQFFHLCARHLMQFTCPTNACHEQFWHEPLMQSQVPSQSSPGGFPGEFMVPVPKEIEPPSFTTILLGFDLIYLIISLFLGCVEWICSISSSQNPFIFWERIGFVSLIRQGMYTETSSWWMTQFMVTSQGEDEEMAGMLLRPAGTLSRLAER